MALTTQDIKDELGITYYEETTERKLNAVILRAKAHLNDRACREIDWEEETRYQQLLIDCIKYFWSNSQAEFDQEYASQLNSLYLDGLGDKNEA